MTDNVTTGTSGAVIAFDEVVIGGVTVKVARSKLGFGADNSYQEVDSSHGLPVSDAAVATIGTRTHGAGFTRRSYNGGSQQSVALTGASEVLLHNCGTARCYFAVGADPTATVNDTPLGPDEKWAIRITPGHKVAVIQDSSAGNLNITPLS